MKELRAYHPLQDILDAVRLPCEAKMRSSSYPQRLLFERAITRIRQVDSLLGAKLPIFNIYLYGDAIETIQQAFEDNGFHPTQHDYVIEPRNFVVFADVIMLQGLLYSVLSRPVISEFESMPVIEGVFSSSWPYPPREQ